MNKKPFSVIFYTSFLLFIVFCIVAYLLYNQEYKKMTNAAKSLAHTNMLLVKSKLSELEQIVYDISKEYLKNPTPQAKEKAKELLIYHKKLRPIIHRMAILDKDGNILTWNDDELFPNITDREYVRYHIENNNSDAYLSPPLISRTKDSSQVIVLSKAIRNNNGELIGIGAVGFKILELEKIFDSYRENSDISLSLVHSNGDVILRSPKIPGIIGQKAPVMSLIDKNKIENSAIVKNAKDGKDRFVYVYKIPEYGIFATGTLSINDWLKSWQGIVILLFTIWIAFLAFGVAFAFKWKKEIELEESYKKELEDLYEKFKKAQEIAHFGNWSWDIKNNMLYWSDEIYHIFGVKPQEFGASYEAFLSFVHPKDVEYVDNNVKEALNENKKYDIFHRIITKDGIEKIVHEVGEIQRDENNKPIRMDGVIHDVTEIKKAEEALLNINKELEKRVELELKARLEQEKLLIQSVKLATMGELTSQLAHHWRQPLNVLMLTLDSMVYDLDELNKEDFIKKIENAKASILKLSSMISKFDNFYRASKNSSYFSIANSIHKTIEFFKENYEDGKNIQFDIKIVDDVLLFGIPNDLEHAILQIIVNARDIFVERKIKNPKITIESYKIDSKCKIVISDNGGGIDPKHIDRIFEPYFTTKFPSFGVGMGLYVVYTIIKNTMDGNISVYNKESGACFEIEFPIKQIT